MNSFTQLTSIPNVTCTLNGYQFPVYSAEIVIGTYGQLGHANFKTSLALVAGTLDNISAVNAADGSPLGLIIPDGLFLQTYSPMTLSINDQVVFGGSYFFGAFDLAADEIHVHARDWAAQLFDTKASLATLAPQGSATTLTVSQFVTNIANAYGLTPIISIANNPLVGTVTSNGTVMATTPIQIWNLLVLLAREIGSNIFTTPDKKLVLMDIAASDSSIPAANQVGNPASVGVIPSPAMLTWCGTTPGLNSNQGVVNPILNADILHQPQRNKNFSVVVISHHAKTTVTTYSQVFIAGEDITPSKNKTIKAGSYSGSPAGQIHSLLSSRGLGIPQYIFSDNTGLTPTQCIAAAQGFANEIAKRLLVYTIPVDGNAAFKPLQQLTIQDLSSNGSAYGFANRPMYITQVSHKYNMPQGDSGIDNQSGFLTVLKCLTLPPAAGGSTPDEIAEALGE